MPYEAMRGYSFLSGIVRGPSSQHCSLRTVVVHSSPISYAVLLPDARPIYIVYSVISWAQSTVDLTSCRQYRRLVVHVTPWSLCKQYYDTTVGLELLATYRYM